MSSTHEQNTSNLTPPPRQILSLFVRKLAALSKSSNLASPSHYAGHSLYLSPFYGIDQ